MGQNARDLSRDIAVDEKLNPQTSAWLGSNYEEYKKLDEQGLVDKPNVGEETTHQSEKHPNWKLGQTSKRYESSGEVGTVSTGYGDPGGISYGTYQISSNAGTLGKYLKWSKYADEFNGLKPNSKAFQEKWKYIAKNDPVAFEKDQHDFIQATHYEPQLKFLKGKGFDLSNRGIAVQDAVWSTSVQYGGGTPVIAEALKGCDISKMTDKELIEKIYQYKHDTVGTNNVGELVKNKKTGKMEHHAYFNAQGKTAEEQRKYEKMRASVKNRFINEKKDLLKLCD